MLAKLIPPRFRGVEKESVEEKEKIAAKNKNYDPLFLAAIQPQGGVQPKDKYIQKGDGYEACIHIWDYPTKVSPLWLEKLFSMREVIVVEDVVTMPRDETVSAINKSMLEQTMRYSNSKKQSQKMDAENSFQELERLYHEIAQMGEVVKLVDIRLYVHAKTIHELEQKVQLVETDLRSYGFKGTIFLNETTWEWQSLFLPYEEQQKLPNQREGKGMQGLTLAAGLPYHFSELNDPTGSYLGTTFSGGNVVFDLFHKDKQRRFYNAVVAGLMGAGKSTLLKKLTVDNACRQNIIRGFDVVGEFETVVSELGGHMISLDGSQGILNPLQIYRQEDGSKEKSKQKSEELCFMQHLSKVAKFYQFIASQPSAEDLEEFKKVTRTFYGSLGFLERIQQGESVTDLSNESYPIFSDLLNFVQQELYEDVERRLIRTELSIARANRLERIELILDNVVHTYGYLFNGHTSIPDFTDEQVIMFSVRRLTNLEKNIFNAQMFNAFTLIWDNLISIGAPQMRAMYEDANFNFDDAIRFFVVIDESHRFINADNPLAVDFVVDYEREARKYLGGIVLASQSIRDYVPEHANDEVVSKIKKLFELTQYKFIMQQDANALDAIRTIFEGQISESELAQIPQLQQGDCFLSISGVGNLMFTVEASDEEIALFRGGM
ncbi:type IV secretion system protein VirB4 [Metasolibacillus sp.]|uniref:VirB4 family type IV secretion system protein n=1 Tax=Metasolibacillus sp. TaxID=2703680 RepID=UPI0025CEE563|nr:type IV secretion system protein VirB4 [Metasolibacillus sp.]MCT6922819.1 type IV secretion system protein VirB4 [Metasolibacillus sp.]MCT6938842.1 type IV secretion system protein VirB4 [Metasolibacillus sp.]